MASVHKETSATTGRSVYRVKYRTPEGKQRSRKFKLARDAKAFAAKVETTKAAGDYIDPRRSTITAGEWGRLWLGGKLGIAQSTRARYEDILTSHVEPRWGQVPLAKISHEDVQLWLSGLEMASASVRKVHRVFSQLLDFAVKSGRLARNPAKGVDLPRVQSKPKRFLSHEQVEALASAAGECRPDGRLDGPASPWRLVVLFLAYTGLRWGELAALRARNLDLERRRAVIEESYTPVRGKMVLSDTKGHERREVPVPKFLIAELSAQLKGKAPDDLVFTGARGAILRSRTLTQTALPKASQALGLARPKLSPEGRPVLGKNGQPVMTGFLHPHELRHTAASLAIAAGADVKVIQQMLGHKSATMTLDLYGHLFPDRLDGVAEAMDAARQAALAPADLAPGALVPAA
ncbi:MAG: site-specific integrase [Bifidobacteriaceae bacterium]|jgi:integrase|nr:site-specific integrase [Bifidobacteriaceae bacterium]